jgi:mannitol/fructose-specific phosphotransferase system IIA component (Ntr-type)
MTLFDILQPAAVRVPLEAADRIAAITVLVQALALPAEPDDQPQLREAILAREQAGSTGIGNGVAIPHARSRRASKPLLGVGRLAKPIDFSAADAKPVSLIFLLAVPEADPRSHLRVLAALSRLASDAKLLKALNKSRSPEELVSLISGVAL